MLTSVIDKSPIPLAASSLVALRYRASQHRELAHVVKFSGGRSSAAMVLSLCRQGLLDADRGDVVLFANTGAEHPATYAFADRVCDEVETRHGIPCLWYEFCTVEDAGIRGWRRYASYRLVSRRPAQSDDSATVPGYSHRGEPFEELASWKAMLPNRHVRLCTQYLKTTSGAMLIADWLGGGPGPRRAGHGHNRRFGTPLYAGQRMSEVQNDEMRRFVNSQPTSRPAQVWRDFTDVSLFRLNEGPRPQADVWGRHGPPVPYVALLGLRSDESERVDRMLMRGLFAEGATSAACRDASQPAGECDYAPLAEGGSTRSDIEEFWAENAQGYDLGIDGRLGNCVYCFMKGAPALAAIAREESAYEADARDCAQGPSRLRWWAQLEQRYAGPSHGGGNFKFLSLSSPTYEQIADASGLGENSIGLNATPVVIESRCKSATDELPDSSTKMSRSWAPCECTD